MCVGLDLQALVVYGVVTFSISPYPNFLYSSICEGHDWSGRRWGNFPASFSGHGLSLWSEISFSPLDVYFYLGVFIVCISNDTRLLEWF